jgi:hypothetical protein
MSNPFKKNKDAGLKKPAKKTEVVETEVVETAVVETAVVETEVATEAPQVVTITEVPEVKVNVSKLNAKEAKAFIAEQFKAKIPVFVIATQDGEHPRSGSWKKAGQKFKLEKLEAYSHRWMKLA